MTIAIIGGTAISSLSQWPTIVSHQIDTPFGTPSSAIVEKQTPAGSVFFLHRHGDQHTIPPHLINYRANIWALASLEVKQIFAVAAVGGIDQQLSPGTLVCPDQLIDYSYDRKHTFFEQQFTAQQHIDFTFPYTESLRQQLVRLDDTIIDGGVYGVTQGPRLETAAEIKRLANDGCTMVGMTSMPEASLAREMKLDYACLALVVNWAAGATEDLITMSAIEQVLAQGSQRINQLITKLIEQDGID